MDKLKNGLFLFGVALVITLSLFSFIKTRTLEYKLADMTNKYTALVELTGKLDKQIEPEQAKLHIDVLRIKNQMDIYSTLVNHQQHRLVRISRVREVIKKTLALRAEKQINKEDAVILSREDMYKMATYIVDYSDQYDVPTNLMLGLLRQESAFDPNAVSISGAVGLSQILPSTGERISKRLNVSNYSLSNIQDNVKFGAYYISKMLDRYKDKPELALQSYLAGEANVDRFIRGEIKEVPYEAEQYSKSVMNYAHQYAELGVH